MLNFLQCQQQEHSSLSVVPSDNSKSKEYAKLRSEINSLPAVRTAAAAAPKSEQVIACSLDSSTSNASSQSAAIAHAESDAVPPCSSSPVDDLVLELQLQHLMDKVPGLAPAMAGFAIKVRLGPCACCSFVACFGCCQLALGYALGSVVTLQVAIPNDCNIDWFRPTELQQAVCIALWWCAVIGTVLTGISRALVANFATITLLAVT
jgi:hypothetical protein